jgi:hypothetical protein
MGPLHYLDTALDNMKVQGAAMDVVYVSVLVLFFLLSGWLCTFLETL